MPVTIPGRLVAVVLMFVGIGFVGLLTGTITTYFLNKKNFTDDDVVKEIVIDVSDLENDKVKQILEYVEFLRSRR